MAFRPLVRVIDNVQRFPDASFVGQWQPAGWLARFVADGLVQEHDRGASCHAPCELCESLRITRVLGMAPHENYFPFRSWLGGELACAHAFLVEPLGQLRVFSPERNLRVDRWHCCIVTDVKH